MTTKATTDVKEGSFEHISPPGDTAYYDACENIQLMLGDFYLTNYFVCTLVLQTSEKDRATWPNSLINPAPITHA